jgi:hypothetical protein
MRRWYMVEGGLLAVGGALAVLWGSVQVRRGVDGDGVSPFAPGGPTFGPWRRVLTGSAVVVLGLTLFIGGTVRLFSGG